MPKRNVVEYVIKARDQASGNLKSIESHLDGIAKGAAKVATVVTAGLGVREIVELADTYRLLQNRMRLVTADQEELSAVTKELVSVSRDTRTSFEATANLYARVARSSRELGLTQRELIDFTTTVQQSIRISGSTAAEASAGVIQFGQALASSRLSGDELRSVLEQMPRLAQAIAEGMGVGIGTLRELGEEGLLTTDKVLDALRKSAPEIAEEFARLKPLVSEAFVVLKSSLMTAIGIIDEGAQASAAFAGAILELSDQIVLFGEGVAGTLTSEEFNRMSQEAIGLTGVVLGLAFAFGALKDALDVTATTGGSFMKHFLSRSAEALDRWRFEQVGFWEAFGDATSVAVDDSVSDTTSSFEKNIGQMTDDMELFVTKWKALLGDIQAQELLDLTKGGGGGDIQTRKEREEIARAGKVLDKFQDSLINQASALQLAKEEGYRYTDALQMIKLRAAGAAAGNEEFAENLIAAFVAVNETRAVEEANASLWALYDAASKNGQAMALAASEGIEMSEALEEIEIKALGAAAENKELADYILSVVRAQRELKNEKEDDSFIESLQRELHLMRLNNKERFIQQKLLKLSADATADQIATVKAAASELFDRQEELKTSTKAMEAIARRAAENIQDAFAEFLFDPFEKGVKGMLEAFLIALRRMIAEAAAAQIFKYVISFATSGASTGAAAASSGTGSPQTLSGGRSSGGPAEGLTLVGERGIEVIEIPGRSAGGPGFGPTLVGERGPELVNLPRGSNVKSHSATKQLLESNMQFISNIDARGADPALIAKLPSILDQRDKRLMLAVKRYLETGDISI